MNKGKSDYKRGKIETIRLKKPLVFNSNLIKEAVIEIDHINYGLNKKSRGLNVKKRSNFSTSEVEKFYGKEFIMIFDTHYDKPEQIHTITLYPGW